MKKIFLILLFINLSSLSSQTVEPVQHKFNFLGNSNYLLSSDSSYFKQDKFMIGWHWGSGKKISKSLLINQNDGDKQIF